MIVISCGVGMDSIALLIEAERQKIRPDLIVFADTGSEHPRTIAYISTLQSWLLSVGFPALSVVRWIRRDGTHTPLHEVCEARSEMPSAAYGFAGCSDKWKRQPVDKYVKNYPDVIAALAAGEVVERWIGFNADEGHRLKGNDKQDAYRWRAPLVEWDIGRAEVRQIIRCSGLPLPGKSSCWLCPHMKPGEVRDLRRDHPELYQRAISIEASAVAASAGRGSIRGLGRSAFAWADIERQGVLFDVRDQDVEDLPCMCLT